MIDRVGYGRGYPWTYLFGGGDIDRTKERYPLTEKVIVWRVSVFGDYPPNTMDLVQFCVDGFRRVSEDAEKVGELAG